MVKGADSTLHAANVRTDVAASRFQSCNTVSALQKYSTRRSILIDRR
jgi:hypothetical protein